MAQDGQTREQYDIIREDVTKLRTDLATMLDALAGEQRTKAAAVREKTVAGAKRAADVTEGQIKERPFIAMLVVMLLGMLLGRMIDRHRG